MARGAQGDPWIFREARALFIGPAFLLGAIFETADGEVAASAAGGLPAGAALLNAELMKSEGYLD